MFRYATILFTVAAALTIPQANAALIQGDLAPSDHMLVTDTVTGIDWVKPFLTRNETYDDAAVQAVEAAYSVHYATRQQVLDMINANFNSPPVGSPGSAAGLQDALDFFNVY